MFGWWQSLSMEVKVSVAVVAALALWLASGMVGGKASAPQETAPPAPSVQVSMVAPQDYRRIITLSGLTEAAAKAEIAAQTAGRVDKVMVERGDTVAKGAPLLQIDPADRTIRLRAAEAELTRTRKLWQAGRELAREGYMAAAVLAEREAAYEAAREQVAAAKLDLSYATVRAPFDGRVENRMVNVGDYVNVGAPVALMVDRSEILLVGYAAQSERDLLRQGVEVAGVLLDGARVNARLRAVATDADTATRTYRVEAVVESDDAKALATGMTATLHIPAEDESALKIPHDWLVLGDGGSLGVMLADAADGETTVRFHQVEVLNDSADGVWVAAWQQAPVRVVSRGQSALRDGGTVIATAEGGAP
ncbi:MAG: efflux RND transporter periplasmic adaptor subunit [Pseudomonadaceae bacterium]|nr:efflux RND transporter periplasmic adaptor subunit [Pseudomonadaceae bacterium]